MEEVTSPVVQMLQALANGAGRNDVAVLRYGCRSDFMCLWGVESCSDARSNERTGGAIEDGQTAARGQEGAAAEPEVTGRPGGLRGVAHDLQQKGVQTLVIVWDGVPHLDTSPVDTTRYLTPLDWVMAVACELDADGEERAGVTVWILRLLQERGVVGETEQFVDGLPGGQVPGVSWAHVVRIMNSEDGPNGPRALVQALLSRDGPAPSMKTGGTKRTATGTRLPAKGFWTSVLTRRSADANHHDLANLLGPQLLLGEPVTPDAAPLRQLVESLGLYPQRPLQECLTAVIASLRSAAGDEEHACPGGQVAAREETWLSGEREWQRLLTRATGQSGNLAVFLVDDLWHLGWNAVLCHAFGVEMDGHGKIGGSFTQIGSRRGIRVLATATPDPVVDALRDGKDLRFALSLARAGGGRSAELLVLDLRLFGGRAQDKEAEFFQSLVEIARTRVRAGNLPWPEVAEDELQRIEDWCQTAVASNSGDVTRNDTAYLAGMTLLPRLIALADPAYPVVVFSSTGQRLVAEKLRPYGNVITAFEKPQLGTLGAEDLTDRVAAGFERALRDALELLAVRQRCLLLPRADAAGADATAEVQQQPHGSEGNGRWTVQVFLDETGGHEGSSQLTVGGLVGVFPSSVDPDQFQETVRPDKLWKSGMQITDHDEFEREFKNKLRNQIKNQSRCTIEPSASRSNIRIAAVAVSGSLPATAPPEFQYDNLFDSVLCDNLHRELVRVVLEGAVWEVARRLLPNASKVYLDVWLPTRELPFPGDVDNVEFAKELRQRWAIGVNKKGDRIRYLPEDAARGLVEVVRVQYRKSTFCPVSHTAVAVSNNKPGAKYLHYVADALLKYPDKVPDEWWCRGFGRKRDNGRGEWSSKYDGRLQALLTAQRHLLAGTTVEALAEATGCELGERNSLERRIQHRLQEALPSLHGTDIQRLR